MARRLITILVAALVGGFVLAGAGCGGGGSSSTSSETTTPSTETTEATTTEATTTEATTTTASTETTGNDFASAKNCQEFAQIGAKISSALTGSTNVQDVQKAFDQLAAAAPAEIKDDFQTLSDFFGQVADALQGVDLSSGQTPSADQIAKLQSLDSKAATQASQNIAAWTTKNCTG
jgi:uncharacterized glyoxalase superfamily protein PhnB